MTDKVVHIPVKPKTEEGMHNDQRFILRYDPNEVLDKRWRYIIKFTRTYEYKGAAATIDEARRLAKRQIVQLTARAAS